MASRAPAEAPMDRYEMLYREPDRRTDEASLPAGDLPGPGSDAAAKPLRWSVVQSGYFAMILTFPD